MLRHANNVAYLRWAEQARSEYMADVLGEDIFGSRGMILAKMTIEYALPLGYREHVAIGCRVARIGTKSFDFEHLVISDDRNLKAATIVTTLVAFDYDANQTIEIPSLWRTLIGDFEGDVDPDL